MDKSRELEYQGLAAILAVMIRLVLTKNQKDKMNRRSILFSLWTLQGLIALAWLALLPTDTEHGLLFGFSSSRLILIGIALALTGFSAALAWRSRQTDLALRPALHDTLSLLSIIIAFLTPTTIIILRALGQTSGFVYTAYADRLAPLAFWFALSALEIFALLVWEQCHDVIFSLAPLRHFFLLAACFLLALSALAAFVMITRLGLTPYNDGSWGSPATPLLEWQVLLALIISLVFLTLGARIARYASSTGWNWFQQDRWTALLVYSFTCLLWLSQPIHPGFFATPPRAPNFEIYPFSDALIYAQYAQSALVGNGFLWPDVPTRPLYITFLTWLHALAGQDYTRVIALQTLLLAAFPVMLYWLGKELGGRPLGIGLAILAAFRDLTANIAAPFALNYTYSKLFFSEIPAALLISLFTLMAIRWMRAPGSNDFPAQTARRRNRTTSWYPLLAGGILGLASLIRLQSAFILIAVIPFGFFAVQDRKKWAAGSAFMALGVALALLPWLARNYLATGGLVFDNPTSQAMVLARRWSGDNGNALISYLPGEGAAQYSSRMTQLAFASLRQDPGRILNSALNHFFNNEIGNLLVFPLRDQLNNPAELLWPEHAFWQTWSGGPSPGQIAIIALYLLLLSLGLAAAWYKHGLPGLLPLGISIAYNAWTALFLSSGDRFLVPVDWGVYLYHFLGLLTLVGLMLSGLTGAREHIIAWLSTRYNGETSQGEPAPISWRGLILSAALILFLGASIPLTELAFPKIPPLQTPEAAQIAPGEMILYGRAIYPRYYAAGDGEPGTAKLGYGASSEARLVFYLLGKQNTLVIFPLKTAPAFFPNASDVAVIGAQADGFMRAREIVVQKDGKSAKYVP